MTKITILKDSWFIKYHYIYYMLKRVRAAFMFLSVGLLLAHTFVPHHHLSDLGGKAVYHSCVEIRSSSLVDLIASFFEKDLGSDHLSKFVPKKLKGGELHYIAPQTRICLGNPLLQTERRTYPPIHQGVFQDFAAHCSLTRGPPVA